MLVVFHVLLALLRPLPGVLHQLPFQPQLLFQENKHRRVTRTHCVSFEASSINERLFFERFSYSPVIASAMLEPAPLLSLPFDDWATRSNRRWFALHRSLRFEPLRFFHFKWTLTKLYLLKTICVHILGFVFLACSTWGQERNHNDKVRKADESYSRIQAVLLRI